MPDYNILIVDYEPRAIQMLREPLEAAGYTIAVAKDGLKGIEAFNSLKPDLTLIEAMLPKKHGFEVCAELKKTPHGTVTPIVIVTSVYKGRKYRTQALHHYGCDEYLEKPIEAERLVEVVERLLKERESPEVHLEETAAVPPAQSPGESTDAAHLQPGQGVSEAEIAEHLDDLFGDPGPSAPSRAGSSNTGDPPVTEDSVTPDDENVFSFDPDRIRKRRNEKMQSAADEMTEPSGVPGGRAVVVQGSAGAVSAEPIPAALPAVDPSPVVPHSERLPREQSLPERAPEVDGSPLGQDRPRMGRFWIAVAVVVVTGALLFYFLAPL